MDLGRGCPKRRPRFSGSGIPAHHHASAPERRRRFRSLNFARSFAHAGNPFGKGDFAHLRLSPLNAMAPLAPTRRRPLVVATPIFTSTSVPRVFHCKPYLCFCRPTHASEALPSCTYSLSLSTKQRSEEFHEPPKSCSRLPALRQSRLTQRRTSTTIRPRTLPASRSAATSTTSPKAISCVIASSLATSRSRARRCHAAWRTASGAITLSMP